MRLLFKDVRLGGSESYRLVPHFGSPDSTGVVLVDCKVLYDPPYVGNLFDFGNFLIGAIFDAIKGKEEVWETCAGALTDSDGNRIEGDFYEVNWSGTDQLLIFDYVEPGRYRLAQLNVVYKVEYSEKEFDFEQGEWVDVERTAYDTTVVPVPPNAHEDLSVELSSGETAYIGCLIVIDERNDRGRNQYLIQYDPKLEMRAYGFLVDKQPGSEWVSRWRQRIDELAASTP